MLVGGARDLPTRQQTLRATLDWSFELLDADAQELLTRLAVFAGGFALADVEAVTGEDPIEPLTALVEAGIVRRRDDRFTLLETVREYALDHLDDADEVRRRHLAHYLAVAETAWDGILAGGAAEVEGMAVQEQEADNLRAAFAFALASGDGEAVGAARVRAAVGVAHARSIRRGPSGVRRSRRSGRRAAAPRRGAERRRDLRAAPGRHQARRRSLDRGARNQPRAR